MQSGLTSDLKNASVRVNQFVKTFDELGLDTLREYFFRASGVYCKEGQKGVDLALGLWFGPDFKESSFSCLVLQIKLLANGMTSSEVKSWFEALDSLPLLNQISPQLPTVAMSLEVGPGRGAEAAVRNFDIRTS